jgi:hypothetical protein
MFKLPFSALPASWGLRGEARAIAQAEYEISDPFQLAVKKLEIVRDHRPEYRMFEQDLLELKRSFGKLSDYEYDVETVKLGGGDNVDLELNKVELKHGKMSQYDYDIALAKSTLDGLELDLQLLKVEHDHNRLSDREFEKQRATLKNEPYVHMVELGVDDAPTKGGYFELDWNDVFIQQLTEAGYTGRSDEDLVNKWFNTLCRQVILDEMQDQDFGLAPAQPDIVYRSDLEGSDE